MPVEDANGDHLYLFHIQNEDGLVRAWDADTGQEQVVRKAVGAIDLSAESITISSEFPKLPYFEHDDDTRLRSTSKENTIYVCNPEKKVSMVTSDVTNRPYEAFVEVTVVDESRAYPLTIDFINEDGGDGVRFSQNIVTKISLDAEINFSSFDKDEDNGGDCKRLTGTYNVQNEPLDNRPDATPVSLRVEIRANPVAQKSQTRCKYYVYDTQLLNGGKGYKKGDMLTFEIKERPDNDPVQVRYEVTETAKMDKGIEVLISGLLNDATSVDAILTQWYDELEALNKFTQVAKVGNGIYLQCAEPFIIDTTEKDLINILSSTEEEDGTPYASVNNTADLPLECKAGFVVKVENTYSSDDDYYVRFFNDYTFDNDTTKSRSSGQGYWKEIARPGEPVSFNQGQMPHIIKRGYTDAETGVIYRDSFVIGPTSWARRTVGTKELNPQFVDQKYTINNLFFYRNRLLFLAGDTVCSSQAGDFTNFFPVTAITTSPRDPIDISADTYYSAPLHAGIVVNNAAVIFSEFQQFILTTDGDVFDSRTAKMSQISKFHFDKRSEPFMLDTNIGFKGGGTNGAKIFEMTNIFREGQVDAIERSKLVFNTLSKASNHFMVEAARESSVIYVAGPDSPEVYLYKYFKESSQKDLMTAWVRWVLPGNVYFQFTSRDSHYAILGRSGDFTLVKLSPDNEPEDDGVPVEASVSLPTLYVVKAEQQSFRADTTASTTIHRIKLNTGNTNYYIANIDRFGKDPYEVEYEQTIDGWLHR